MSNEKLDGSVISIGLGLFGLTAGMVCALTLTEGASTSLMTSMFTFVSGAVLSYSAFKLPIPKRREAAGAEPRISTLRIGLGLSTFSIGVITGVIAGMWIRYKDPLHFGMPRSAMIDSAIADGDNGKHKDHATLSMPDQIGLHAGSGAQAARELVQGRLDSKFYDGPDGLTEAKLDLSELLKSCP